MSEAPSPKAPHLVEAKPLTFVDHVVNIFHLVIKELQKHPGGPGDADSGRLLVQHFGEHGRDRSGDGSDKSLGRHRRRGRVGPVAAHRRGASAADLPAAGAYHRFRHRPDDGPGQALVRRRNPAEFRGRRSRPAQDRHPDQCRRHRGRPGRQRRKLSPQRHRDRDPAVHLRAAKARPARRSISWCAPPSTRTSRRRGSRR